MSDEWVVVRGTVIGDAGAPVAGWVAIDKGGQRWISRTLRIAGDDGHEITLDNLDGDELFPIAKREVVWSELEQDAQLATLLASDAPAPDVEVKLRHTILRGGDRVTAWGQVADRGYVGGDSLRGSVEGGITRVNVRLLAYGADSDEVLEDRKEALLEKERKLDAKLASREAKRREATEDAAKAVAAKKDKRKPFAPILANIPLLVAVGGLIVSAGAAALTAHYSTYLVVGAIFAWAPRALDSMLVSRFRNGRMAPPSLELVFIPWVIISLIVPFFVLSMDFGDPADPMREGILRQVLLWASCGAGCLVLLLSHFTRERRRFLAILANAPEHPDPVPDGVWGASVGHFTKQVLLIGEEWTRIGSGTGKNASYSTSPFAHLDLQGTLARDQKQSIDVQLGDAAILTLAKMSEKTGERSSRSGQVIDATTPAIAAGRAREGTLIRTGEASMLVFASPANTDVRRELRRLRRREQIATVLAVLGGVCIVGAVVLRFMGSP